MLDFNKHGELEIDPSSDVIFCPFVKPGQNLGAELDSYEEKFNVYYPKQGVLAKVPGTLYVWGHGNYKDVVAGDPVARAHGKTGASVSAQAETLGARQLAGILQSSGLPTGFGGDIVVWTCWGGVPGGAAQGLLLALRNKGYNHADLKVWGSRYLTGGIWHRTPVVFKLPQYRVVGDDETFPFGTGMQLTSNQYSPQDATGVKREDLLFYPSE